MCELLKVYLEIIRWRDVAGQLGCFAVGCGFWAARLRLRGTAEAAIATWHVSTRPACRL